MSGPVFAVCWKAVELRSSIDPLTGEVTPDPLSLAASPADEAALEWALRSAERWGGRVRLVSAGGPAADPVLRQGAAVGATELVRVDLPVGWPSDRTARAVAPHVADAHLVWCGDMSADRGSGAFPAYLASELGVAQALGLVGLELLDDGEGPSSDGPGSGCRLELLRRLDGGRRERVLVDERAVLSCEGATARLRRATLGNVLVARAAPVALREAEPDPNPVPRIVSVGPFRPRARVVAPPAGPTARERTRALTGVAPGARTTRAVRLDPAGAAGAILEALDTWGELP
jgi:electron transfer flavoprotein beta subunit